MLKEAMFYEKLKADVLHCYLCAHNCKISPSQYGICAVRKNKAGRLYSLVYAELVAASVDPIEKKPLYHFLPGSKSYSIATAGCNFKCGFCQNWQISQAERQESALVSFQKLPQELVSEAEALNCKSISYTYTEPTIFFEYAFDSAMLAKKKGIYNCFVTNGFMTSEALEAISPFLDAANVDLKSFRDDFYKNICHGRLQPVLDTIKLMKKLNIWIELTTLIVPGLNDSEQELKDISEFIASVGVDIPWHISRFHPDYKLTASVETPIETLRLAKEIGEAAGLRYIYLGNVFEGNDTYCYNCKAILVERSGLTVEAVLLKNAKCPKCATVIDGIF